MPAHPSHDRWTRRRGASRRAIARRRDIHHDPEPGNPEARTAGLVAGHLRRLGDEVHEAAAVTGVVATLHGGAGPGSMAARRADMDALSVVEQTDLPFASRAGVWDGVEVPVVHACGHDDRTAILMAASRAAPRGTVTPNFQPAGEDLPRGEIGGVP